MSTRRSVWIGVGVLIVGSYLGLAAVGGRLCHPGPQTESGFIRDYTPEPVIAKFRSHHFGADETSKIGRGEPGDTYVTNEVSFQPHFVISEARKDEMMYSLLGATVALLQLTGAEIIGSAGDAEHGYHISYATGQIIGSIEITPHVDSICRDILSNQRLPIGMQRIEVSIKAQEHWFPSK
jgi:hypothetical protein